jgi:chromosome segregation ATPase
LQLEVTRTQTIVRTVEAQNEELRAHIAADPAKLLLNEICASLNCVKESELLPQIGILKGENLYLKSQTRAVLPMSLKDENSVKIQTLEQKISDLQRLLTQKQGELREVTQAHATLQTRFDSLETDLKLRDENIPDQRLLIENEKLKAELAFISRQNDESVAQCQAFSASLVKMIEKLVQFSRTNPRFDPLCRSLQRFLGQFDFFQFSDQRITDVVQSMSEISSGQSAVPKTSDTGNGISQIVQRISKQFLKKVSDMDRQIQRVQSKVRRLKVRSDAVLEELRDVKERLHEFMLEDMAPKVASLEAQLRRFQNEQGAIVSPPRGHTGVGNAFASPSEMVLGSTRGPGSRRRFD